MLPYLISIGYNKEKISFVPVSGLTGVNLDTRESQPDVLKKWYNEANGKEEKFKQPKCLVEIIDEFKAFKQPYDKPTRLCIYDYYNRNQDGSTAITGDCCTVKIASGILKEKDKLLLMPNEIEVTVKSIEVNKKIVPNAHSGQLADISISIPHGFDSQFIKTGHVLCDPAYPVFQIRSFRAKILVYELEEPITPGRPLQVFTFSNKIAGKISKLEFLLNQKNEEVIKKRPIKLVKGNYAQVVIKLDERVCLELLSNNKAMGRFALRDAKETIAAGIVFELLN